METKSERLKNYLSPIFNYFELSEQLNKDDISLEDACAMEIKINREYEIVLKILPKIKELVEEE